jgi:hypothetical protein
MLFYVLQDISERKSGGDYNLPLFIMGWCIESELPTAVPIWNQFLETAEVVAYTPNCREQSELGKPLGFYLFLLFLGFVMIPPARNRT